jgi:hypothetical protein
LEHAREIEPTGDRIDDRDAYGLLSFAIYLALSVGFFGRALFGHFREVHIGYGGDPPAFMWSLTWWPHAIIHGLNPFFTNLIWAPEGLNLAWMPTIPLPSLVLAPVTLTAGPLVAFNVLSLLASPLAAWTAFLLCRRVSGSWWSALIGGYIFGFSAYMLGASLGRPHLTLVFLVPLAVLVFLRAISGETRPRTFIIELTAILVAQFLISIEVFATMTAVGAVAIFLAWSFSPPQIRSRIPKLLLPTACAFALAMLIVSPFLYFLFALPWPHGPIWSAEGYSSDVLNFLIPASTNQLGVIPLIGRLAAPFCRYGVDETGAYIGLPLLAVFAVYAWHHWREPTGKLLVDMFIIMAVLALGPLLHIRGAVYCELPFKVFRLLPLLDKTLPARFMMYAFLLLALMVSIWFASNRLGVAANLALASLVAVFALPNLSASYWTAPDNSPKFFTGAMAHRYLAPDENVLVLPFGVRGNGLLWQAQSGMNFRLAEGWTGNFRSWPIYDAFLNPTYLPGAGAQLASFMAHHSVRTVVIANQDRDAGYWTNLLASMNASEQRVGGVTICRLSEAALEPYVHVTAVQMRQRASSRLFDQLILAADRWLSGGNRPLALNPLAAERHGLLPVAWRTGKLTHERFIVDKVMWDAGDKYCCGVWLGELADGRVGVGLYSSYGALQPLIDRYGEFARQVYFPYPAKLAETRRTPPAADKLGLMVMEFDPNRVVDAAARIKDDAAPALNRTDFAAEAAGPRRSPASAARPPISGQ